MSSLLNLVPRRAILAETGEVVDVNDVKISTVVAVKEGEIIPIDGVVMEGNCEVDEKTLTGESFPVTKQKDSTVWAGTINVNGYITVRTTVVAEDSVVARMTKLVEEAQSNKSRMERYMEKFAKYYTPSIVFISAALAIFPAILRVHNQRNWYHLALVVLVSACPCALVLSTPVAMFCALTKAAKIGVFFKGADYLEALAGVKVMAFDKTGTITRAEFKVTEFRPLLHDISLNTMLYWVSSIESRSSHPMAAALVDLAKSHSVEPKPEQVEQFHNFPGEGIYGHVDGKEIYIGNSKISTRAGCQSVPKLEGNLDGGKTVGYIFLGSTPAGIFCLADICRTGAKEALNELKSMGIKSVMITGDCYAAAKHAQDQLGGALEVIHADLLPEDKARIIKDFQKQACTAMIGDGINDAPALATADIGISMGVSGSALATETGHVILMTNDIQRVPKVAKLARQVKRKILENIIISITTKGSILGLAIAGHPLVWAAVLADVGTCLLVIFNSMLLLKGLPRYSAASHEHKHQNKCSGSHLLNRHQPCCHATEPQKHCHPKKCSSNHCAPIAQKHICCGHHSQIQKTNCSDSGSCNTGIECVGESKAHHHGKVNGSSSGDKHHKKCSSNTKKPCCHDITPQKHCEVQVQPCSTQVCAPTSQNVPLSPTSNSCGKALCSELHGKQSCCQIRKDKCSEHGTYKGNVGHDGETGCCNSTKPLGGEVIQSMNHCLQENPSTVSGNDHIITVEETDKMVKICCNHDEQANKGKNHACDSSNHSAVSHKHVPECSKTTSNCMSLENRHVGGCCESFRKKECCVHSHSGHFGTNFRGGLPEIVIE